MAEHKFNRRRMLLLTSAFGAAALSRRRASGSVGKTGDYAGVAGQSDRSRAHPFNLRDVRLLDSPFKNAMQLDGAYLLKVDPDRFLSYFRETAGLKPKAPVYGGWEAKVGRMLGHHLSACSMMYSSTGDARFLDRANYMVNQLAECQRANGNGYVGGIPDGKRVFSELAAGEVEADVGNLNRVHAPWYMMHKVFAGLRDAHLHCESAQARQVLVGLADWTCHISAGLTDEKFQRMLNCEYGGMNEVLADVYSITGDKKYLELAARFNHHAVLDPLIHQRDQLDGLHANTQIPKVMGMARQHELTGEERLLLGATFFWEQVTRKRSYVIGGNSDDEHFSPIGEMAHHLNAAAAETCNTYNMLKLTRQLFCLNPRPEYANYYERALYNHILASQDPDTGMMIYFFSLQPGHFKTFSTPFESFWCCVGTGMENHAKYGDSIYFHDSKGLFVNLFIPSEIDWKQRGIKIRQETKFPEEAMSRLTVTARDSVEMAIRIRHPYWADSGLEATVNGKPVSSASEPGGYLAIARTWKDGDVIELNMPMKLHIESMADDKNKFAILYGPLVLGGTLGDEGLKPPIPFAGNNELEYARVPDPPVPFLAGNDKPVDHWVRPVPGKPLNFVTTAAGNSGKIELMPVYAINRRRYAVYWDRKPNVG